MKVYCKDCKYNRDLVTISYCNKDVCVNEYMGTYERLENESNKNGDCKHYEEKVSLWNLLFGGKNECKTNY